MLLTVRLVVRQTLCGLLGLGFYFLLAAAARPTLFVKLPAMELIKLVGLSLLGYVVVTVACSPLLAFTWKWRHWWIGTVASAVAAMIGAGGLYRLSWGSALFVGPNEFVFLVWLALPIAAVTVIIHRRSRTTVSGAG